MQAAACRVPHLGVSVASTRLCCQALAFYPTQNPSSTVHTTPCCLPLVPVTELMVRGRVRMSMMWGVCTQGILKCVPSPVTSGRIPLKRSKITARSPPSTARASTRHKQQKVPCGLHEAATARSVRQHACGRDNIASRADLN
jgi:hypothetical protein